MRWKPFNVCTKDKYGYLLNEFLKLAELTDGKQQWSPAVYNDSGCVTLAIWLCNPVTHYTSFCIKVETRHWFTLSVATLLENWLTFLHAIGWKHDSREVRDRERMRGSNREVMWEVILSKSTLAEKESSINEKKSEGIEKLIKPIWERKKDGVTRSLSEKYKTRERERERERRLPLIWEEKNESDKLGKERVMCGRYGQGDHSSIAPDIIG